jgi:DNA invertase Pin-like site-specific DNA recombinase
VTHPDDGYSGIIFDRPAFQEMMEEIKQGKINCVVVKDMSRLGRDYIGTGNHLRKVFPAYGVRFIAVNDNIDTSEGNSGDELSINLKTLMNDTYSHDISVKTRSALSAKRKNGEYVGACAVYGYLKSPDNKNQLVIDEYAAGIVQDIFRMKLEGISALKISEELNRLCILSPIEYKKSLGLPRPKGGYGYKSDAKWSFSTVLRILKDEIYTGTLVQGKQETPNYKIKSLITKPCQEWIRTENAHEPIIRKNDLDLVQRIMRLDTRTSPSENKVYIFSGILVCGSCGGRMTRKTVPYKGQKYAYYCCSTGHKNGCTTPMVKENEIIECVFESVKAYIRNVVSMEKLLSDSDETIINKNLMEKLGFQINSNKKKLYQFKDFGFKLYENLLSCVITKDEYKEYKAKYENEIQLLESANSALKLELEEIRENRGGRFRWMENFKRFENISSLDRKTVIQLIQSVKIMGKKEIQITFNYQSEYEKTSEVLLVERIFKEAV